MLNPQSEYFKENVQIPGDYFKRIKHTNLKELRDYISRLYSISKEEYVLGIKGQQVFETDDEALTSLYVIVGIKK